MVVRIWRGSTPVSVAKEYQEFVTRTGIADYQSTPGNLGAGVIQQQEGDVMHIWTVSQWDNYESIKGFAGEEYQKARYYEEDKKYLLQFEPNVFHYETLKNDVHSLMLKGLVQLYGGGGWYGDSYQDKLKDVTDVNAFKRPLDETHSIAEILSHCTYWRTSGIKRLQGDFAIKYSMKDPENWQSLEVLQERGWKNLLALFQRSQIELVDQFLRTPEEALQQEFHPGHILLHLIEGIIQHDIYHLGQIGLVKKMIS